MEALRESVVFARSPPLPPRLRRLDGGAAPLFAAATAEAPTVLSTFLQRPARATAAALGWRGRPAACEQRATATG